MDFEPIWDAFRALQLDPALNVKSNLHIRAEALDTLTFINEVIRHNPKSPELVALSDPVRHMRDHLESINTLVFKEMRDKLKSHNTTKSSLRALFNNYTNYKPGECGHIHIDYEAFDVLISGTFFPENKPIPQMKLNPEMVHWEASPGSVLLDLLDHVNLQPDDVFFDMGSGLGNVAFLVNLLSGIKTVGIEREPVYCNYAQQLAKELSLDQATFINTDARDADLSTGTVFYLFTPFVASILDIVMEKIHNVSQYHPIHVCSFGPCTSAIAQLPWLHNTCGDSEHEFKLAVFRADERVI